MFVFVVCVCVCAWLRSLWQSATAAVRFDSRRSHCVAHLFYVWHFVKPSASPFAVCDVCAAGQRPRYLTRQTSTVCGTNIYFTDVTIPFEKRLQLTIGWDLRVCDDLLLSCRKCELWHWKKYAHMRGPIEFCSSASGWHHASLKNTFCRVTRLHLSMHNAPSVIIDLSSIPFRYTSLNFARFTHKFSHVFCSF